MPGSQPPEGKERSDQSTRKIIDRLDRQLGPPPQPGEASLHDEVIALKASTVKYDRLIALIAAAGTVIVSAAWTVQAFNLKRMQEIHVQNMRDFREDVHEELRRSALMTAASYQVTVEKRAPATVAQEVRSGTLDAGVR